MRAIWPRFSVAHSKEGANGAPAILDDGAVVTRAEELGSPPERPLPTAAGGAVIVPAHNESAVIARTLRSLSPLTAVDGLQVIVVCNGCTDGTAEIARSFEGIIVAETAQASKIVALNMGDEIATTWPRLYLDADIEIAPSTVLAVFDALREPGVLAARAYYIYDSIGATLPVRAYYRARSRATAPPSRLWGAGGYATSRDGHRRFGRFPRVTADDSWFDGQFAESEKQVVAAFPMKVRTPRDVTGLLAVLARQRRGYLELDISSDARSRSRGLVAGLRTPRDVVDAAWYVVLTAVSRGIAARLMRRSDCTWERDRSSRGNGMGAP